MIDIGDLGAVWKEDEEDEGGVGEERGNAIWETRRTGTRTRRRSARVIIVCTVGRYRSFAVVLRIGGLNVRRCNAMRWV